LAERFGVPPFSVLDARQGYWQTRKRTWLALGIQSELGRGEGESEQARSHYAVGSRKSADQNSNLNNAAKKPEWATSTGTENMAAGTSIFDPVLCELAYRWFCPDAGIILDPFAGGSVRGIVAAELGRQYIGIDLSAEQIAANEAQAETICGDVRPAWKCGDSSRIAEIAKGEYDFIFSCPPYADLEVYSDNPADLSTMPYEGFIAAYRNIIAQSVSMLRDNRFACFVVGDIRDKKGFYWNFVSDTIAAFEDAGAILYNEAILVTAVGSLAIRVGKPFGSYRKLGKTHQNVLVFFKGNPKEIPAVYGECDFSEESPDMEHDAA